MFELVVSGGWVMWPLILCSIIALAIVGERLWALQKKYISPSGLVEQVQRWLETEELNETHVEALRVSSPLGRILAAGLVNRKHSHDVVREAVEDAGRHVLPELERFLNTLGSISAIAPFLGLLGTVVGMIKMFAGIGNQGVGDPTLIATGISQALITTAAGLLIAIPGVLFYRYFRGKVNELILEMEQQAIKFIMVLHHEREKEA